MKVIPRNEAELIFRFAQEMPGEWELLHLQTAFPDANLKIRGDAYRAEFEFRSKNFLLHKHDAIECDLVICWVHNWPGCPLPVLCLQSPGWSKARIPRLSPGSAVGWQKAEVEENPISQIQKAQEKVTHEIHAVLTLEKSITRAKAARKRAEVAVTTAQRQLRKTKRDIAKADKPDKAKPLPRIEEEPERL